MVMPTCTCPLITGLAVLCPLHPATVPSQSPSTGSHRPLTLTLAQWPLWLLPGLCLSCAPPDFQNFLIYPPKYCRTGLCHSPPHLTERGVWTKPGAFRDAHTPGPAIWHLAVYLQAYKSTNRVGFEPSLGFVGRAAERPGLPASVNKALPFCHPLSHPQSGH